MPAEQKLTRSNLEKELRAAGDPIRAGGAAAFFKIGKGDYGEGDVFLGISTPVLRKTALRYRGLSFPDIEKLLASKIHEHRSAAIEILVAQYKSGDDAERAGIVAFYLRSTARINNWDLVDGSAPYILGEHLRTRPRQILKKLANSRSLWERRIAMVATLRLVRHGELDDALNIAEMLLDDEHDLMHKATGWVLREVGKKDRKRLLAFLETYYDRLPRTALRYAIEHFTPEQRKKMLAGKF